MCDFIYCKKSISKSEIQSCFDKIYSKKININYYESNKFQLVLAQNIYNGFNPYLKDDHLCAVIGGPLLNFRNNSFIKETNSNKGTKAIYDRWIKENKMIWDIDLDGPFVVVLFNLNDGSLKLITDMMSFIPVYYKNDENQLIVSTHLNLIDSISYCELDKISVADFIVNNVVVFPYTILKNIFQIHPASVHQWKIIDVKPKYHYDVYWLPNEDESVQYRDLNQIATRLRVGIENYIQRILQPKPKIGILMSGGEDSRSIAAMIPKYYPKDGFIFSESINYEVKITKKIAQINKVNLKVGNISCEHFAENVNACSKLIGVGADCAHVHAYEFISKFNFYEYDSILGGFLADTFLKSLWAKKKSGNKNLIFGNFRELDKIDYFVLCKSNLFNIEIIDSINKRRRDHWSTLKKIRPKSVNEWMGIWPMSMQRDIPNIWGHRRLFRNYEPFTATEVVKVGSLASQHIKNERKLFHKALKPYFKNTKWIPHNKGYLPYFNVDFNNYIAIPLIKILNRFIPVNDNRVNTFSDWNKTFKNEKLIKIEKIILPHLKLEFDSILKYEIFDHGFLGKKSLNEWQKRNLIQLGLFLSSRNQIKM